jgi:hypothetical protein
VSEKSFAEAIAEGVAAIQDSLSTGYAAQMTDAVTAAGPGPAPPVPEPAPEPE